MRHLLALLSLLGLLAAATKARAQYLFSVGWDTLIAPAIANQSANFAACTTDTQDNSYLVTYTLANGYEYWTVYKCDPFGKLVWKQNFANASSAMPNLVTVDSSLNVYVLGTERSPQNYAETRAYKISPSGALIFSKSDLEYLKLGNLSVLAARTDAQNNLHVVYEEPNPVDIPFVQVETYNSNFVSQSNFQDTEVAPSEALFDANMNVYVDGLALNAPAGTFVFEAYDTTGNRKLHVVNAGSSTVYHGGLMALSNTPGVVVLVDQMVDPNDNFLKSYIVSEMKLSGKALWTSPTEQGAVTNMMQNSSGNTFFNSYSTSSNNVTTNSFGCFGPTGTLNFNATGTRGLLGCSSNWGYFTYYDTSAQRSAISAIGPYGGIRWTSDVGTAGQEILTSQAGTLSNGVAVFGTVPTQSCPGSGWIEREVEGVALASLSTEEAISGTQGSGTVILNYATPKPLQISLSLSGPVAGTLSVPVAVTVPAGSKSAAFTFPANNVNVTEGGYAVAKLNGVVRQAYAFDLVAKLSGVSLNATTVSNGSPVTGTISLNGVAGGNGTAITMTSDHPSLMAGKSFTIASNTSSAAFTAPTVRPSVSTIVNISFKDPFGAARTVSVTLKP